MTSARCARSYRRVRRIRRHLRDPQQTIPDRLDLADLPSNGRPCRDLRHGTPTARIPEVARRKRSHGRGQVGPLVFARWQGRLRRRGGCAGLGGELQDCPDETTVGMARVLQGKEFGEDERLRWCAEVSAVGDLNSFGWSWSLITATAFCSLQQGQGLAFIANYMVIFFIQLGIENPYMILLISKRLSSDVGLRMITDRLLREPLDISLP